MTLDLRLLLALLACCAFASNAQNLEIDPSWWSPNGSVMDVHYDSASDQVFIAGDFDYIGPQRKFLFIVDTATNELLTTSDQPNNKVLSSISDGNGGWFIAGEFTMVGDSARAGLAHLDSLGKVTPLLGNIGTNAGVFNLAKKGDTLFIAGNFVSVGQLSEYRQFGALLTSSGVVSSAAMPEPNGTVYCSVPDGNGGLFIGGDFSMVGDSVRNNLAHIDAFGTVSSWNPTPNSTVRALALQGDTVYIGGSFRQVDGLDRDRVAAIDRITSAVTAWNPGTNGPVLALFANDSIILVGGSFTMANGMTRNKLAAISTFTGAVSTAWPECNSSDEVRSLVQAGDTLYVSGKISTIGGQTKTGVAALRLSTQAVTPWGTFVGSGKAVNDVVVSDTTVFLGGEFSFVDGVTRNRVAAVSALSGNVNSWNPAIAAGTQFDVQSMQVIGSLLHIVGSFTSVNGAARYNMAAVDLVSAALDPWAPISTGIESKINTIASLGSNIYVGGNTPFIGGQFVSKVAAIDLSTETLLSWNPGTINSSVTKLLVDDYHLYLAGTFSSINGSTRNKLARLQLSNGSLSSWNPNPDGNIYALEAAYGKIYIGGEFENVSGQMRRRIACFNNNTGALNPWTVSIPSSNSAIHAIEAVGDTVFASGWFGNGGFGSIGGASLDGGVVALDDSSGNALGFQVDVFNVSNILFLEHKFYLGGNFSEINSVNRSRTALLDNNGNLVEPFPSASANIRTLTSSGKSVLYGGDFLSVGGVSRKNLASYQASTGMLLPFDVPVSHAVQSLAIRDSTLYLGGNINNVNGQYRSKLAAVNKYTGVVSTFNSGQTFNYQINAILLHGDTLFVGGEFTSVAGQTRNRLAALNASTGALLAWSPGANNNVNTLCISGNSLYAGGKFSSVDGLNRRMVVKLSLTSGAVSSWSPNPTTDVHDLEAIGSHIIIAGAFHMIDGQDQAYLAAVDTSGVLSVWNPVPNATVFAIERDSTTLFCGGNFSSIGGAFRSSIAAIDISSGGATSWVPQNEWSNRIYDLEVTQTNLFIGRTNYGSESSGSFAYNAGGLSVYSVSDSSCMETMVFNESVCGSYYWAISDSTYTSSSTDTIVLNGLSCDSTFILQLTINPGTTTTQQVETCDSYLWQANNQVYVSSGSYADTTSIGPGCDSISNLQLTIHQSYIDSQQVAACDSYLWSVNNHSYSSSGTYVDSALSIAGCDSISVLILTINQSSVDSQVVEACDSYLWSANNQIYAFSGTYLDSSISVAGCDSISILQLTIHPSSIDSLQLVECHSYVWPVNNQVYTSTGVYADTLVSVAGCDSILTLDLTVLPQANGGKVVHLCQGESYTVGNNTYTQSGVYNDILTASNGCDSLNTLFLVIHNDYQTVSTNICFGDSVFAQGAWQTQSGVYLDSLTSQYGCDSVIQTTVTVINIDTSVVLSNTTLIAQETAANEFRWVDCMNNTTVTGATLSSFTPLNSGSYFVEITKGACIDSSSCKSVSIQDTVDTTVAVRDLNHHDDLVDIYPNPTTGLIQIRFKSTSAQSGTLQVLSVQGALIHHQQFNASHELQLDLGAFHPGLYFIDLSSEQYHDRIPIVRAR